MEKYTIEHMSQIMNVSKQTLRYYDTINLITPTRSDNGYRSYTEADRLDLQLILMLKRGSFSLDEIRRVLNNRRNPTDPSASLEDSKNFMKQKKVALLEQISDLEKLVVMIDTTLAQIENLETCDEIDTIIGAAYKSSLQ